MTIKGTVVNYLPGSTPDHVIANIAVESSNPQNGTGIVTLNAGQFPLIIEKKDVSDFLPGTEVKITVEVA